MLKFSSLMRVVPYVLPTCCAALLCSSGAYAAESGNAAAAATAINAVAPNTHLELVDPQYRSYVSSLIGTYDSEEAIAKANEEFASVSRFTNIVPQLIKIKSEQDNFDLEVALYKPQKCEKNIAQCPVFNYKTQYNSAKTTSTANTNVANTKAADSRYPLVLFSYAGGFLIRVNYYLADYYQMLSNTLQAVVAVPRYRLASEAPFPAPVIDNYSALTYLIDHAADYMLNPDQVVLMGNSAGGGLSAALALFNRDHRQFPIKAQVLIYPMLDYHTGSEAYHGDDTSEYIGQIAWNAKSNAFAWEQYGDATAIATLSEHSLPDEDGNSSDMTLRVAIPPYLQAWKNFHEQNHSKADNMAHHEKVDYFGYFSPSMAKDLGGLPPTFINIGDLDLFAPESLKFAGRLLQAGNVVEMHLVPGVYHLYELVDPNAMQSQEYYHRLFSFLDQRLMAPQGQVWKASSK